MIYEYECPKGHIIEANVKLNGEGAPTSCSKVLTLPCPGASGYYCPVCDDDAPPVVICGAAPLKRILSLTSGYFPGAGSWRGA